MVVKMYLLTFNSPGAFSTSPVKGFTQQCLTLGDSINFGRSLGKLTVNNTVNIKLRAADSKCTQYSSSSTISTTLFRRKKIANNFIILTTAVYILYSLVIKYFKCINLMTAIVQIIELCTR